MSFEHTTGSVPSIPLGARPRRGWSVAGAIAFAVLIVGGSMLGAMLLQATYASWHAGLEPYEARDWPRPDTPGFVMGLQLAAQLAQLAMAWLLARLWHGDPLTALNLEPVRLTIGHWLRLIGLLLLIKMLATIVAQGLAPSDTRTEMAPFVQVARAPRAWLIFLIAVLLAGLTEELIFRGVLSRTLEATRLGFWAGAALASGAFALLHVQYGPGGQLVIFAIGMTLAWIRASTGSVWPAIVCHALNNGLAFVALLAVR